MSFLHLSALNSHHGSCKKPFDDRIYSEWEALALPKEPLDLEEKEVRAKRLFDSCLIDGVWIVALEDASLVTILCLRLAMEGKRYEEVVRIVLKYLEQTNAERYFPTWDIVRTDLGFALILSGRPEVGLETLFGVLEKGLDPLKFRQHLLRGELLSALHVQDSEMEAVPLTAFKTLAVRLLTNWPGHQPLASLATTASSNAELIELFKSTFLSER